MNSYRTNDYNNGCNQDCGSECNVCSVYGRNCVSEDACGCGSTRASGCGNACGYVRACGGCSRTICGFCSLKAAALFGALLALAVGIILGTVYAETFFPALAAIIVFAIIMAVAVIALLLYRRCEC